MANPAGVIGGGCFSGVAAAGGFAAGVAAGMVSGSRAGAAGACGGFSGEAGFEAVSTAGGRAGFSAGIVSGAVSATGGKSSLTRLCVSATTVRAFFVSPWASEIRIWSNFLCVS